MPKAGLGVAGKGGGCTDDSSLVTLPFTVFFFFFLKHGTKQSVVKGGGWGWVLHNKFFFGCGPHGVKLIFNDSNTRDEKRNG